MAEIKVKISEYAYQLIKQGVAEFSKGGVKMKDSKQFIELFKPLVNGDKVELSPNQPVMDLLSNLGKDLNAVRGDINGIAKNINGVKVTIENFGKSFNIVKGLSWVSASASIVNCGMTAAGFAVVCSQLNEVNKSLATLSEEVHRVKNIVEAGVFEKADKAIMDLQLYLNKMAGQKDVLASDYDYEHIAELINEISAFMKNHLCQYLVSGDIDCEKVVPVLFPLMLSFKEMVKEYSISHWYKYGKFPPSLSTWEETIKNLQKDDVKNFLYDYLHFYGAEQSEEEIALLYLCMKNDFMDVPVTDLEDMHKLVELLSKDEYFYLFHNADVVVSEMIQQGQVEFTDEGLFVVNS